jgi:hypothetical protein
MTTKASAVRTTPIVDDNLAPEVFADGAVGVFSTNGNAHITFFSRRCDHSQTPGVVKDIVVGRLIMPAAAMEHMVEFLGQWIEQMKAKTAAVDEPRTIQ